MTTQHWTRFHSPWQYIYITNFVVIPFVVSSSSKKIHYYQWPIIIFLFLHFCWALKSPSFNNFTHLLYFFNFPKCLWTSKWFFILIPMCKGLYWSIPLLLHVMLEFVVNPLPLFESRWQMVCLIIWIITTSSTLSFSCKNYKAQITFCLWEDTLYLWLAFNVKNKQLSNWFGFQQIVPHVGFEWCHALLCLHI